MEGIHLKHRFRGCTDCAFQLARVWSTVGVTIGYACLVHECMRLARAPLARCRQLTVVRADVGQVGMPGTHFKSHVTFTRENLDAETLASSVELIPITAASRAPIYVSSF